MCASYSEEEKRSNKVQETKVKNSFYFNLDFFKFIYYYLRNLRPTEIFFYMNNS
jgi:hypothetical protein